MAKQYFTVAEANRMIPELERGYGRMTQLHTLMRDVYGRLEDAGFAPESPQFELSPEGASSKVVADRAELKALHDELAAQLHHWEARGCVIKSIESGLADWYALFRGREIFLCWRLGEKEVGWWHELDAGFPGRRPVSELDREVLGEG
jgi:hypothetical protein